MNFTHESNRIFLLDDNSRLLAEVTFPDIDPNTVNINHTYVDSALGGQGIAGKLMEAAVSDIRERGKKIIPTCSYAVNWFEKHPEHGNLLR